MPWKLTPSVALRENVIVVLRDNRSTWLDCSTAHRCCTEVGVYLTLVASPSAAAATDLQKSTSIPVHSPLSLAKEKPGRPRWTPHSTWPRALIASSVGLGDSCWAQMAVDMTTSAAAPGIPRPTFMARLTFSRCGQAIIMVRSFPRYCKNERVAPASIEVRRRRGEPPRSCNGP